MSKGYTVLENIKYNEQRFSGIVAIDSIKFCYRPLYNCYQLQFSLGYYVNYRRRKEEECIDLRYTIVKYNIETKEVQNIPAFIKLRNNDASPDISVEKQFESIVNNSSDYRLDLLLEYEKEIGEYIYSLDNKGVINSISRICGYNENEKALRRLAHTLDIGTMTTEIDFHKFMISVY